MSVPRARRSVPAMPTTLDLRLSMAVAGDVMRSPVLTCDPTTDLVEVASRMAREHVHCIVVDASTHDHAVDGHEWEFVTALDVVRGAATGAATSRAGDVASGRAVTVRATDDLDAVAAVLAENDSTHALVVSDGAPVGMLSGLDLVQVLSGAERLS